jgi:hypothetical protein
MKANEEAFKNVLIFLNLPENEDLKNQIADEIPHMAYMLEVDGIILGREDADEIKRFFEYLYPVTYRVVIASLMTFFAETTFNPEELKEVQQLTEKLDDINAAFEAIKPDAKNKSKLYENRHIFQQNVVMPFNEIVYWKNRYDKKTDK